MKRFIYIWVLILSTIILSSCDNSTQSPILLKESNAADDKNEEKINYKIEKVVLSKGYQVIEPHVKLIKKDANYKLLASLGLINSSGADVVNILKSGSQIDIYTKNKSNKKKTQLVVPQILIDLKDSNIKDIENLSFNIINENYEPINVKIDANKAINKINADFGISTSSLPSINISKTEDELFWNLKYKNIFDKHNKETPLVNLSVKLNANNGDIVKSSKTFISSLIDEGYILDYSLNKYILYKKIKPIKGSEKFKEELWTFHIDNDKRELLYSSKNKIQAAIFGPELQNIAVLESVDNNKNLYIINQEDKKAYKVLFENNINPNIIKWKDKNNMYIVDNKDIYSNIYNYNIEKNETILLSNKKESIVGLNILDEKVLISKMAEDESKDFYLTEDFNNALFKKNGMNPNFIARDKIGFLKNKEKENKNILYIYDFKEDKLHDSLNINICNYHPIDDDNLFVIEENQNTNDYTLYKYNISNKKISTIANINSSNIYLNSSENLLYLDSALPYEDNKNQIIYSLDLSLLEN